MSIQNIQIDGNGSFNDTAENAGVVTSATFAGTAVNTGTVTEVAVFEGNSVNTGTVAVAEFKDSAVNAGTVSTSAVFADTSENSGTVSGNATFTGSSENTGSIVGDAIFADTTVNTGSVAGNAQVASTADNSGGTVTGSVTEYVPPSEHPAAGTVLSTNNIAYTTVAQFQVEIGTYDIIADGFGGSAPGNYSYTAAGFYQVNSLWYTFDGNGGASHASGTNQVNGIWYTFDGTGSGSYATAGTYQLSSDSNKWYTFDGNGGGGYATGTFSANDGTPMNYTYNGVGGRSPAEGYIYTNYWFYFVGGVSQGYANQGTYQVASDSNKWYTFDGTGSGSYATGTLQVASDSNKWYTFDGTGSGSYATGTLQASNGNWYTFDGNGGGSFASAGTYQVNGSWYTFDGDGGGSFASAGTYQATNGSWYTFDGSGGAIETSLEAVADAYATDNNLSGQYQSSGRYYFQGSYVGDEAAYNTAVADAEEVAFQTWLSSNVGVSQYTVSGVRFGQWAYDNVATDHEYVLGNNPNWAGVYVDGYYDTSSPTLENGGLTLLTRDVSNDGLIYSTDNPTLANGGKVMEIQSFDGWMGEYSVDADGNPSYDSSATRTLENGGLHEVEIYVLGWAGELIENPNWARVGETVNTPDWGGELIPPFMDMNATRTLENGGLIYQ